MIRIYCPVVIFSRPLKSRLDSIAKDQLYPLKWRFYGVGGPA